MKKISFFAVLLLVVSLSCKKDSANTDSDSDSLKLELVAVNTVSATSSVSNVDTIVAVLDVNSYNANTGEITFNNEQLPDKLGEQKEIKVYNKGAHLFTFFYTKPTFSNQYNEPVLYHSLVDIEEDKKGWYILSGYPYGKVLGDQTITDTEQLKGFQKIKSNWDVFVDELKKSGKYIN